MAHRAGHEIGRLDSVQYLRALAALFVVFEHARVQVPAYLPYLTFDRTNCGVDIFFVISGLVMSVTAEVGQTGPFLARRLIRIAPLYWFFTLLLVGLLAVVPDQFRTTVFSPAVLVQSLLFIPHDSLGHPGQAWPLLVPGWTLNFEIFFYLVFGLLISLALGYRILVMGLLFSIAVICGRLLDPATSHPIARTYTDPILFEFLAGMVIGYAALRGRPLPAPLAWLLVATAFVLIALPLFPGIRVLSYGIPAVLLVCGAVNLERRGLVPRVRVWNFLGDASYSIYLSHVFSFGLWRAAWVRAGLVHANPLSAALFAATALIFAALAGGLVYVTIERPLLKHLRALLRGRRSRPGGRIWAEPGARSATRPGPARETLS